MNFCASDDLMFVWMICIGCYELLEFASFFIYFDCWLCAFFTELTSIDLDIGLSKFANFMLCYGGEYTEVRTWFLADRWNGSASIKFRFF